MAEMNVGICDFYWVRGSTEPLIVEFMQNGVPISFDDARLTVSDKLGNLLFRMTFADNPGTGPGTVSHDIVTGKVTFHPLAEQTRALIASRTGTAAEKGKNKYEVELREGADEHIYLLGTICAIGGLNDDEEEPS
jgi:hypothetical protein